LAQITRDFWKKSSIFIVLIFALALGQAAIAAPLCTSGTMASYANTSCAIGNFLFTFGANPYLYSPDDTNVPASAVTVTPYGTGAANDPTGFTFSAGNWTATNPDVSGTNTADINITFDVLLLAPSPYIINGTSLALGLTIANETGQSGVLAGENISDNADSSALGAISLTGVGNTDASSLLLGGTALTGSSSFQAANIHINKDINLVAFDTNSVQVNSILETFTYTSVPEPGPFVLTAAGIGLLALIRRRKQVLNVLGAIALVAVVAASAHATPLCTSGTLQDYINAGQCTLGGVTFTFNASSYSFSGTGTAPTASGILVSPTLAGTQVGFQFTPNAPAPVTVGTQTETFTLTYTAMTMGEKITKFAAQDTVSTHGTGTMSGSTAKLKDGATTLSTVTFPNTASGGGVGSPAFSGVLPGTTLTITDTFTLSSSGSGLTNNTHLSNFTNTLTQTPEPLTSALCGAGLLVIGLAFRRRAVKS
jgi:PEP-CTERM motif